MKIIITCLLFLGSHLYSNNPLVQQLVRVSDKNNELLSGARVELIGTDKVYYTNSKGECLIPLQYLNECQGLKIECISYQSALLKINDLSQGSKIILEFR